MANSEVVELLLRLKNEAGPELAAVADQALAAAKAEQTAQRQTDALGASFDEFGGKAGKLAGGLGAISPTASNLVRNIGDLSELMAAIASPTGIAAAAIGGLGLGVIGLVGGLGHAVLATDDALESLAGFKAIGSDFYPEIPDETLAGIEAVNASMDALSSIMARAVAVLGAEAAPAFEQLANVAVGLALEAEALFERFIDGRHILHDLAVFVTETLLEALLAPLQPLQWVAQGILALARVTGTELPAGAAAALQSFVDLEASLAETAVTFYEGEGAGAALGEVYERLGQRGAAFIATQTQATKATKDQKEAAKEAAAAERELEEAIAARQGLLEIVAADDPLAQEQLRYEKLIEQIAVWAEALGDAELAQRALNAARAEHAAIAMEMQVDALGLDELDAAMQAAAADVSAALDAAAEEARAKLARPAEVAQSVVNATGSVSGLASALGPGAVAGVGALGVLQGIGQDGGIFTEATSLVKGATEGLQDLPEVAADFIREILVAAPEFVGALASLAPELIEALIGELTDPQLWLDVGKALLDAILEVLTFGLFKGRKGKSEGGDEGDASAADAIRLPAYETGTDWVASTGRAIVHQGEAIVNASGTTNGRLAALRGGGGPSVQINSVWPPSPDQLDAMVRELGRVLGTDNLNQSWPAGA